MWSTSTVPPKPVVWYRARGGGAGPVPAVVHVGVDLAHQLVHPGPRRRRVQLGRMIAARCAHRQARDQISRYRPGSTGQRPCPSGPSPRADVESRHTRSVKRLRCRTNPPAVGGFSGELGRGHPSTVARQRGGRLPLTGNRGVSADPGGGGGSQTVPASAGYLELMDVHRDSRAAATASIDAPVLST